MDASVTDELVADHEWESMLHTFEPEADELSPGAGGAESDDLWERLSTTRWLKSAVADTSDFEEDAATATPIPVEEAKSGASSTATRPSDETAAI